MKDSTFDYVNDSVPASEAPVETGTTRIIGLAKKPTPRPLYRHPAAGGILPSPMLQQLLDGSLLSPESWYSLPRELQEKLAVAPLEVLLEGLVSRGLLTLYQADRVRSGSTHGLVIGNYRILNRIGAGGMGIVFKAEQIKLQRPVALKILAYSAASSTRILQRFWAETRAVAQLQHPNIVAAIDAGESPGASADDPPVPYFVMEYLDGKDLEDLVIDHGPMDIGSACKYASQMADALAEAHRNKLIHRDIKPSNVFITSRNQAKLLDFGLVRQQTRANITEAGMTLGTVGYMAPEQAKDPRSVDERADIFALGCTLYWALAGEHPFGEDFDEDWRPRPGPKRGALPLRSRRREVPMELDELVRRMMSERPEDRPRDAISIYRALLPYIPGNEKIDVSAAVSSAIASAPAKAVAPQKPRVLVVDDAPTVRLMCTQALQRSGFEVTEAPDGGAALEAISKQNFDLMLLDYQLPDLTGSEVLKRTRETMPDATMKVVVMSGMRDTADLAPLRLLGADDCITKPFTSTQLLTLIRANLTLKEKQDHNQNENRALIIENTRLKSNLSQMTTELTRTRDFLVQTIAELIGERNYISGVRALRLQRFCRTLAEEAARIPAYKDEVTPEFIHLLETWVPLLDVGHLLLPEYLLLKPMELAEDERDLMQAHTTLGADLLSRIASHQPGQMAFFHMAITITRYHHERFDGSGYPDHLQGGEIPLAARIAVIADVYDALRSHRVYRPAQSHNNAVQTITENSPGQFDPNLIQAFLRCHNRMEQIFRELPD